MRHEVSSYKAYTQIKSQPSELQRIMTVSEPVAAAASKLATARRVFVVGTGTSYNATLFATHCLRTIGVEVSSWTAYDFAVYGPTLAPADAAIVYSHSGGKQYSQRSLERVQAVGATGIWVTGQNPDADNPADVILHTVARETSSMFTVSHTVAMLLTARVVDQLKPGGLGDLAAVPDAVSAALSTEPIVLDLANQWHDLGAIVAVGGGPHEISALEIAIKINEGPRMRSHGYSIEQFLHGPQAQMQADDALVVFGCAGAALERTQTVAQFGLDIGVPVAWVAPAEGPSGVVNLEVMDVGESLAPIVQAVPGQLLAAHLAAVRGVDCDSFRLDESVFKRAFERYSL